MASALEPLDQPGQCPICREAVGARADEAADVRMGCGCGLHYSCLVRYLHSKLGDRGSLSLSGVHCPSGAQCASLPSAPLYFITLADLDIIVLYGASEAAAGLLSDGDVAPLTHDKVMELRAWLEESAVLEALKAWLGDLSITDDERRQLEVVKRGEPAFDALVRQSAASFDDPNGQPELTAELAAALRARLRPLREGYKVELDPYVAATSKACPTCSLRATHWHGHQCHHISPLTRGCPGCRVGYCFKCLSSEVDNQKKRGGPGKCMCGSWTTWCKEIKTAEDVTAFVAYKDGIPFDSRCGCVFCSECRFGQPCPSCPGNCGVCRGVLNAAPGQANPPSAWVALRHVPLTEVAVLKSPLEARLWEAIRQGDAEGLTGVFAEAGEGISELLNCRDRWMGTCLHNACDGGHAGCVALLLRAGIDVNHADESGDTALMLGVVTGRIECVRMLLATPGIKVNQANSGGESALFWGCREGGGHSREDLEDCMRLLLAHPDIDVNQTDQHGETALTRCSFEGYSGRIRLLLAHDRIDANYLNGHGNSALMISSLHIIGGAAKAHTECVSLLSAHPGTKSVVHAQQGELMQACRAGDSVALAAILCTAGLEAATMVNGRDLDKKTCLNHACAGGRGQDADCIALLLGVVGIDVNHSSGYCNAALTQMCQSREFEGQYECIRLLLAHPAIEVNHTNKHRGGIGKGNALFSIRKNGNLKCTRLILAHPDIDAKDAVQARLWIACHEGDCVALAAILTEAGSEAEAAALTNCRDWHGRICLYYACAGGHTGCVALLLGVTGIDINLAAFDEYYDSCETALMLSCQNGHTECVRLLLAHPSIDVNHADKNGKSALLACTRNEKDTACIKLLLSHPNLDVNQTNKAGDSALILSSRSYPTIFFENVVELLLAHPCIDASEFYRVKLLEACTKGNAGAVAEILTAAGKGAANALNVRDRHANQYSCLCIACDNDHSDCVALLLGVPGIDVSLSSGDGRSALVRSSAIGRTECVRLLLTHPDIDVNHVIHGGYSALIRGCCLGRTECVRLLLAHPDIDVNLADSEGRSALTFSISGGHTECVRLLLAHPSINVNHADGRGRTPLKVSSGGGHTECTRLLMAHPGIKSTATDAFKLRLSEACRGDDTAAVEAVLIELGASAAELLNTTFYLQSACSRGNLKLIAVLLGVPGIDVNLREEYSTSALFQCFGNTECMKLLLGHPGINVNQTDRDGQNALVANGWHTESFELLVAHPDIDVNQVNDKGETPLTVKCQNGQTEFVRLLLAHPSIDVNHADKDGDTVLIECFKWKANVDCVRLLVAHPNLDVNQTNKAGDSALMLSCYGGLKEVVKRLLTHPGMNVNQTNKSSEGRHCLWGRLGYSALVVSSDMNYPECLKLLLAYAGIDVNGGSGSMNALIESSRKGHTECVRLLLAHPDIDVNLADSEGRSALTFSISGGYTSRGDHTECVRLLLAHPSINVNHADGQGSTPLILSSGGGHTKCTRLLMAHPSIDVNHANKSGNTALIECSSKAHVDCVRLLVAHPGIDVDQRNERNKSALDVGAEQVVSELIASRLPTRSTSENEREIDTK